MPSLSFETCQGGSAHRSTPPSQPPYNCERARRSHPSAGSETYWHRQIEIRSCMSGPWWPGTQEGEHIQQRLQQQWPCTRAANRTLEKNLWPDWSSKLLSCVTSAPPAPLSLRVEEGACTRPLRRKPENLSSLALPEFEDFCMEPALTRNGTMSAAAALPDGTCSMKSDTRAHRRMAASPCHLFISAISALEAPDLVFQQQDQICNRWCSAPSCGVQDGQDPGSAFSVREYTCGMLSIVSSCVQMNLLAPTILAPPEEGAQGGSRQKPHDKICWVWGCWVSLGGRSGKLMLAEGACASEPDTKERQRRYLHCSPRNQCDPGWGFHRRGFLLIKVLIKVSDHSQ